MADPLRASPSVMLQFRTYVYGVDTLYRLQLANTLESSTSVRVWVVSFIQTLITRT